MFQGKRKNTILWFSTPQLVFLIKKQQLADFSSTFAFIFRCLYDVLLLVISTSFQCNLIPDWEDNIFSHCLFDNNFVGIAYNGIPIF